MFYLVAYDIANPKRLAKVAKTMKNYGVRVQKSVFECDLNEKLFLEMKIKVDRILDFSVDSVRYYALCERCAHRVELSGVGLLYQREDVIII